MISVDGNRLLIEGPLTMNTVATVLSAPVDFAQIGIVDMQAVTLIDSSALGAVLHWLRQAKAGSSSLKIEHAPANLNVLADLYGLKEMLPLDDAPDVARQ